MDGVRIQDNKFIIMYFFELQKKGGIFDNKNDSYFKYNSINFFYEKKNVLIILVTLN